jgi:hypothetical protein
MTSMIGASGSSERSAGPGCGAGYVLMVPAMGRRFIMSIHLIQEINGF